MSLPRAAANAFTEEEKIVFFKVFPCGREYNHDFAACFYSHPGEKAKRRCLLQHVYCSKLCPDMKEDGLCPRGDACDMTHSMFEYYMHPLRYRTKMCKDGSNCNRPFCFFAHQLSELRQPAEADTFLASLSPQALANTADKLVNNSSSSLGRHSSSGGSADAAGSPHPLQVVYHAPPLPTLPQQHFPTVTAAPSIMSSNPLMQFGSAGVRPPLGTSSSNSTRLLNSPSSGVSSNSSNLESILMMRGSSLPASSAGSGELPGSIPSSIYQPVATSPPGVLLSPPRPMIQTATAGDFMLSGVGAPYSPPQQQQLHTLAGMLGQMSLSDAATSAAAPAVPSAAAAAARASFDEAVRRQQQQDLLTTAALAGTDIASMLQQQQQQQLSHQLAVNLAVTAAEMACLPPLGTVAFPGAVRAPTSTYGGGNGAGLANARYENFFEAPLFAGVTW